MSFPSGFLYEPFSNSGVTQPYDQNLKCAKCGAFYSMHCPLRDQSVWSCLFCSHANRIGKLTPMSPNAYTLISVKESTFERRTVLILDAICGPHELDRLTATLCNTFIPNCHESIAIVTIQRSGHVILHNAVNPKRNVMFSIDEFMTKHNLTKLNAGYFKKKIEKNDHLSYWFDKSAHNSLRNLLQEISKLANKAESYSKRDKRCTGLALLVSSVLASQCDFPNNCHILSFLNGPCTKGGGKVISRECGEHMRQNHHFDSENPKLQLSRGSIKFYKKLFKEFEQQKLIYEFFISSLDQIGILEMGPLVNLSMAVSQFDSFNDERFDKAFHKYLRLRNKNAIYNCKSKIITAKGTLIVNAFPDYTLNPKNLSIPVGIPLDCLNSDSSTKILIQFQTTFENEWQKCIKIENVSLPKTADLFHIQNEVVLSMKKLASNIVNNSDYSSTHAKHLTEQLALLPNQIRDIGTEIDMDKLIEWYYYLYKSPIISARNTSPDERYLFLHQVINSNRDTCLSLCKPFVWGYDDTKHDWIVLDIPLTRAQILQDTKTTLCVDGGSYLALRMGELFQKKGREFCSELLNDLQKFPQPLYVETKVGGSQDRFLKSKIIPLDTTDKGSLGTEDMTFQDFLKFYTSSN